MGEVEMQGGPNVLISCREEAESWAWMERENARFQKWGLTGPPLRATLTAAHYHRCADCGEAIGIPCTQDGCAEHIMSHGPAEWDACEACEKKHNDRVAELLRGKSEGH